METVAPETGSATADRRLGWWFALVPTSVVTVAGLIVALQQFVVKFLWDQSAHTRTPAGVLYMLLGLVGICLLVLLFRFQARLLSLPPSRRWLLAIGIPLAYALAFGLFMEASTRSTNLILPRRTPTAVVLYEPADMRVGVWFRDRWTESDMESSYNHAHLKRGDERFSASLYQGFMRRIPRREMATISGRVKQFDDDTIQISLDVDAMEPVLFSVENIEHVKVVRDGQSIGESESQSGEFQLTITGHVKDDK